MSSYIYQIGTSTHTSTSDPAQDLLHGHGIAPLRTLESPADREKGGGESSARVVKPVDAVSGGVRGLKG